MAFVIIITEHYLVKSLLQLEVNRESKKQDTKLLFMSPANVDWFSKFIKDFTCHKGVATQRCEILAFKNCSDLFNRHRFWERGCPISHKYLFCLLTLEWKVRRQFLFGHSVQRHLVVVICVSTLIACHRRSAKKHSDMRRLSPDAQNAHI